MSIKRASHIDQGKIFPLGVIVFSCASTDPLQLDPDLLIRLDSDGPPGRVHVRMSAGRLVHSTLTRH